MAPPKRKSPEKPAAKKRPTASLASRALYASGAAIARRPRLLGGLSVFGVVFSFIAANALWYQPAHHPAPMLATRMFETKANTRSLTEEARLPAEEPGTTTFRIERQDETVTAPVSNAKKPVASPLVQKIQAALASRGLYDGPADGLTGPRTTSAILFFEETEGLTPTGEATDALLARLRAAPSENTDIAVVPDERPSMDTTASTSKTPVDDVAALISATPAKIVPEKKPPSPALVMKIQKALAGLAYENVKVDGIAGDATRAAIRAFEKSYRLPVTGEPSDRVLSKLKAIGAV